MSPRHLTILLFQSGGASGGNEYLDAIQDALKKEGPGTEFKYAERDVMLYNLGVGAKRTDLRYVL